MQLSIDLPFDLSGWSSTAKVFESTPRDRVSHLALCVTMDLTTGEIEVQVSTNDRRTTGKSRLAEDEELVVR